uniref:Uncharacterized protein n=1 Tax=Pithovirus LCPAC304 TaxID=2506594 RepID=A0A481ZAA4_9VIRU|nr:MAG: hypothetical protein LCPAC304_03660 [Pithovirus LCPAC304]
MAPASTTFFNNGGFQENVYNQPYDQKHDAQHDQSPNPERRLVVIPISIIIIEHHAYDEEHQSYDKAPKPQFRIEDHL